ncbi:MAG: NAD-dependent epimerase/dehydratase family protein [Acidobacteriota bacterium]
MPERRTSRRSHSNDDAPTLPGLQERRILVTGAAGFVGRRIVDHLLERGCQVVAIDMRGAAEPPPPGVIRVVADVGASGWHRWAEGCVAAVHLAGAAREEPKRGVTFERVHVHATRSLVASLPRLGVERLVHVSAAGAGRDAASAYLRSKWAAEEEVRASRIQWTIIRPSLLFGPGDCFSATLADCLRRLPLFPVPLRGSLRLQPLDVRDLVALLAAALERPDMVGQEVQAGGPEVITFDDLVRRAGRAVGRPRTLIHLGPRSARFLVGALQLLSRPPISADQLATLLADSISDASAISSLIGTPLRRYEGPTWLVPAALRSRAADA